MAEKPSDKPNGAKKNCYNGYQEFCDKIKSCKTKRVAIFTHKFPDPDAMSSMASLAWLLQRAFGIESDLYYDGEVSHPQNQVMLNLLAINLKRVAEEYKPDLYCLNILVDTIPENAGIDKQKITFDVVIDHHRELPHDFDGVLVHKKVGACASIIFDMMKHFVKADEWLDADVDEDCKIATALLSGIVTDTEYLMSDDSTEYEFKAFSELFPYRNSNFIKQIVFFKRPKFWIEKKAEASSKAMIDDEKVAVVGLGIIPDKQRDLIADMAEEMVSWANVETAVAFGVVGGDRIEGSVRTLNASLTVSEFCKKLGGKWGVGGGKLGKGAYRLPLAGFSIDPDEEQEDVQEAWETIKTRETKRILRSIKK